MMYTLNDLKELLAQSSILMDVGSDGVDFWGAGGRARESLGSVSAALGRAGEAKLEPPTCAFAEGYFEQYVAPPTPGHWPGSTFEPTLVLKSIDNTLESRLGRPTMAYFFALLLNQELSGLEALRSHSFHVKGHGDNSPFQFEEIFLNGLTIQITEHPAKRNRDELRRLSEAVLFNYSACNFRVLLPIVSWEPMPRGFHVGRIEQPQFPRRMYDPDLVAYYQLGRSSETALLSYLSLYNVIEHFFSQVTEQALHKRVTDVLVQPGFSHTKKSKLRDLVKAVRAHDNKTDEPSALKLVLEKHFDPRALADWVIEYEKQFGAVYTSGSPILGESVPISTNAIDVAPSMARRIYHFRCLLVHNKEGEKSRYIPFSDDDKDILRELPLLIHLAEGLIIGTATDL